MRLFWACQFWRASRSVAIPTIGVSSQGSPIPRVCVLGAPPDPCEGIYPRNCDGSSQSSAYSPRRFSQPLAEESATARRWSGRLYALEEESANGMAGLRSSMSLNNSLVRSVSFAGSFSFWISSFRCRIRSSSARSMVYLCLVFGEP